MNQDQPLWLPEGSVRSLVAITVVVVTVASLAINEEVEKLTELAFLVLGFYFGNRSSKIVGMK